jgi:DNA-binding transcriptional LysR family regulator
VTVRTLEPEAAIAALARGAADVALVDGITAPDNPLKLVDAGLLHSTALVEVPLVVALTATHPLRRRREIDLDTLADAPWVMTPGLVQTSHQHHPAVVYAGTDLPTLLHLVAAGHGAALLPATAVAAAAEVVAIPVGAPPLVHRTEALTRRQHRAIDAELIDALRAA